MADFNYTTGPSTLPDIGKLSYNGCVFSPLFATDVSGNVVKDAAQRTVKYMEYDITADGYVTLSRGETSISPTMDNLRFLLTKQGGTLTYQGRGMDLVVNPTKGVPAPGLVGARDVAWGPVPELLEFQPLGGGLSAKVVWRVKVRIYEGAASFRGITTLLQFNYETILTYGEDGYSTISVKGTQEIPMTRPNQNTRTLTQTVDDFRGELDTRIFAGIDLGRFRVTRREFNVSRDKRTMEFNVQVDEKPYMDNPPGCTVARGNYTVRPARAGMGLCLWLCTLRATYTVRADFPRREAWFAFLALLRFRMANSIYGVITKFKDNQNPPRGSKFAIAGNSLVGSTPLGGALAVNSLFGEILKKETPIVERSVSAWLIDFSFDEGLYQDSKTVSFSATWRLTTSFSHILLASGLWKKVSEKVTRARTLDWGKNLWAVTMSDIMGSSSWLPTSRVDPKLDIIVDFGG